LPTRQGLGSRAAHDRNADIGASGLRIDEEPKAPDAERIIASAVDVFLRAYRPGKSA